MSEVLFNKMLEEFPIVKEKIMLARQNKKRHSRIWKSKNKEKCNKYMRDWREKNKEHCNKYRADHRSKNREHYNKYARDYNKRKKLEKEIYENERRKI